MTIKKWAVCRAEFPDDTVEDERDIIQFPGRNIAEALRETLTGAGCTDVSGPLEKGEHGWHVRFKSGGRPFYCQVSRIEPETLLLFDKSYGSEGLFYRGPSRHAQLLERLQPALAQDRRYRDLTWYTQKQMDTVDWQLPPEASPGDPEA